MRVQVQAPALVVREAVILFNILLQILSEWFREIA